MYERNLVAVLGAWGYVGDTWAAGWQQEANVTYLKPTIKQTMFVTNQQVNK